MPPIHTSFAWVVVAVVPVFVAVLSLPLLLLAVTSTGPGVNTPLYSPTTAAAKMDADKLIVMSVPAPDRTGAYQISVVVLDDGVVCTARAQAKAVPVLDMLVTALAVVLRVETTATRVLPLVGAVMLTVKEFAAVVPTAPVLLCTRIGVA